jgi:hypothetical protein
MAAKKITKKDMDAFQRKYQGMQNRLAGQRAKADELMETVVTTIEIGAVSFGLGMVNGYWVDKETGERGVSILGVPLDLGLAVGMHLVGFMGSSRMSSHFHAFGNAALASFSLINGMGIGDKMRLKAAEGEAEEEGTIPQVSQGRHSRARQVGRGRASGPATNDLRAMARSIAVP